MAQDQNVKFFSGVAAEDLSDDAYKLVKVNTSGTYAKCTATADIAAGIIYPQGQMVTGEPITIAKSGLAKIALGATVAADDKVGPNTSALAIGAVSTAHPVGQIVVGGASGEIGIVDLNISLTPLA